MRTFLYLLATFPSLMFEHQSEEKQKQIVKLTPESFKLFNIENVEKGKQKMSLVLSSDAI